MDELAKLQKQVGEEIERKYSNYKKDSKSRKNKEYLEDRRSKLSSLWEVFQRRHEDITTLPAENQSHSYFVQKYYEQVKCIYEKFDSALTEALRECNKEQNEENHVDTGEPTDDQVLNSETQAIRFKKQKIVGQNLMRIINAIEQNRDKQYTKAYYKTKQNTLINYWADITSNHNEIMAHASPSDEEKEYIKNNLYEDLEDAYQDTMIYLQECCDELPQSNKQADFQQIKLPPIELPNFNGSYLKWKSFHDLYVQLIHNNTALGKAQKLQYLKANLSGEASKLLQHLQVTDANYETAWELLNHRYNNTRLLVSTQLNILLSQSALTVESASGIKKLHDTTKECLFAINNLEIDTSGWGTFIVHIISQKLDKESQKLYEQGLKTPREVQPLEDMFQFLEMRFQSLEAVNERSKKEHYGVTPANKNYIQSRTQNPVNSKREYMGIKGFHGTVKQKCLICKGEHDIYNCKQFIGMSIQDRLQHVKKHQLCQNCLKPGHNERVCKNWKSCRICRQKHNTIIHTDPQTKSKEPSTSTYVATPENYNQSSAKSEDSVVQYQSQITKGDSISGPVLLATAMVKVISKTGHAELLRALIDQGSQASFVTEDAAQRLNLSRVKIHAKIGGLGTASAGIARSSVQLLILPRFSSNFQLNATALVLTKLTKVLPAQQVRHGISENLRNLLLADPTYDQPGPIDIILGADVFGKIILDGVTKGNESTPVAQRTEFGWILSGKITNSNDHKREINVNCLVAQSEIETQLRKFWEIEEITPERKQTQEEIDCEKFYETTVVRSESGRYTVRIPFNPKEKKDLGRSKGKALARLLQMERKFETNKSFEKAYKDFMEEYLNLGHMKLVKTLPEDAKTRNIFYIPHHAVINENSSTTKLRVVFDASAKSSTGVSLNDITLTGPTLQQNLTDILMRWRKHKLAFISDIEKMYRQIRIAPEDRDYQRILWRRSRNEPVKEYQLTTVTYGTRSAPYLAIKTLRKLAHDDYNKYPEAANIALKDFYVDDLISGCDSIEEGLQLQKQLISMLNGGGFKLRKWASNNPEFLGHVPEVDRSSSPIQFDITNPIKTLGVLWHPITDCFQFRVGIDTKNKQYTKRSFLSEASKLFDPLGWLAPAIIQAKVIFQELWVIGLTWDQDLPENIAKKWQTFKEELKDLEKIRIPRWIENDKTSRCELHGFSDASEKAYAAVVYAKVITTSGKIKISLLTAKTKVAPISKPVSLPRLELCGALLLANLMKQVRDAMEFKNVKLHAYTDSTIVLSWIKSHPNKWKTFVANRVGEIQSILNTDEWHHVTSNENPADCASRGLTPRKLVNYSLWWEGPPLLKCHNNTYNNHRKFNTELEVRTTSTHVATTEDGRTLTNTAIIEDKGEFITTLLTKYSSFFKIMRIIAYCHRFAAKAKGKPRIIGPITAEEMETAKITVLKLAQQQEFAQELKNLIKNKPVERHSKLLCLNPILDENGLIRVGGRLQHSELSYETKHPIILPYKGAITTLIIDMAHKKTLHGGIELTLSYIRNEYWIIKGYSAVKQKLHQCTTCFRFRANTATQMMGNLPAPRVTATRPFTNTGVDYAGPLTIRASKGRGSKTYKGYISIFVCLATKAIHLEAVSDLTAQAFLAAFKRFVSRRGNVLNMYSDNGTNFVLANKILQSEAKAYTKTFDKIVCSELSNIGTQWHFIPPASPHFGGLWEAGVKSVKYHLKRIIGEHKLTFEELQTVLTQIEASLNSRPLCPITDDPESIDALTPGHFLIGSAIIAPAARNIQDDKIHTLTRWQLLDRLHQTFWKRWSSEYLGRLQQRPKWTRINNNVKTGELILIKDEQQPPTRWALGKIIETHPGQDGLTRVVTIKTKNGTVKRPITKICTLPLSDKLTTQQGNTETISVNSLFTEIQNKPNPTEAPKGHQKPQERKTSTAIEDSVQKEKTNYSTLFLNELKRAKRERAHRNPKRIRIHPVSGYQTLVSKEIQEKAKREYAQRYQPTSSKRQSSENSKISTKRARHDNSFTLLHGTILCLLVLFLTKLGRTSAEEIKSTDINIIPFKDQPGIFFEKMGEVKMETSEWKIIVFFDLSSYWTELLSLQKRVKKLTTFCDSESTESKVGCKIIISQLNNHLDEIEHKNEILYQHNGDPSIRQKRSPLNIVGSIANKLFGVLDEEFAAQYEEQIRKIKSNENHLLALLKNQTSIQEATSNIIKQTRSELADHLNTVEQQVHAIASSTDNFTTNQKRMEAFFLLISHTMLAISSYQNIQNAIIKVIIDTQNSKISPLLLTPEQLRRQLKLIRGNLPENVLLPSDGKEDSILELYKLMSAKTRITRRNVIFDVTIPLFSSTHFQLFHMVPVPTPHNEYFAFVKPSTDYLIVNLHRDQYYPITQMELKGCIATLEEEFVCKQQHPLYTLQSNESRCEMNLLRNEKLLSSDCNIYKTAPKKLWIPLHTPNNWIFVMDEESTLNIICGKTVSNIQISRSGIMQIQPQCAIQQSDITINSHYTFIGQINTSFTPSANLSEYLQITINQTDPKSHPSGLPKKIYDDTAIAALDKAIEVQRRQEKLPETVDGHDIHQYSLIYLILIVLITGCSYMGIQKIKSKKVNITAASCQPTPHPAPRTSRQSNEEFVVHYSTAGEYVG